MSTVNVLLIGALLCVALLLLLISFIRSGIPGVREWTLANVLGVASFLLYAYGRELPPLIAYEVANGVYAAAMAAMLAGFRRFFGRKAPLAALGGGIAAVMVAIAVFHYWFDSFALRTVTISIFQVAVCAAIWLTVAHSGKARRARYPYVFTQAMVVLIALGHTARAVVYAMHTGEMTSLLQPSAWNLVFLSAGTSVLPVLTFGAVMLVHDRMMATAEHAANRDFLTGAWSRRAFFDLAERELASARRTGRELSLLLIDVDHFKSINDTAGHAAGDRVLMDVVRRAETVIRNVDYFARVGGEEFAALLPETGGEAAAAVAERLRKALERQASTASAKGQHGTAGYTVSIGMASLQGNESLAALMRRADSALYAAKAAGRNVVCMSDGMEPAVA